MKLGEVIERLERWKIDWLTPPMNGLGEVKHREFTDILRDLRALEGETRIPETTTKMACIRGVEGDSIYLNNYRIAGPKPWGGGPVIKEWTVRTKDIYRALESLARAIVVKDGAK